MIYNRSQERICTEGVGHGNLPSFRRNIIYLMMTLFTATSCVVDPSSVTVILGSMKSSDSLFNTMVPIISVVIGSVITIFVSKIILKNEIYFNSIEKEVSIHKKFRREFFLIFKVKKFYAPDESEQEIMVKYFHFILNNCKSFERLRDKWIGIIDDKIIERIDNLIILVKNIQYEKAVAESNVHDELTLETFISIDEELVNKYFDKILNERSSIDITTKNHLVSLRESRA